VFPETKLASISEESGAELESAFALSLDVRPPEGDESEVEGAVEAPGVVAEADDASPAAAAASFGSDSRFSALLMACEISPAVESPTPDCRNRMIHPYRAQ
jgi:hypothetical protein